MKLLRLLAALLLTTGLARAETTCGGTDLLARMQQEKPAVYAEVMQEAAATPNGEAIMWKVEKDGIAPSFLLGTAHVTDPRVTTLAEPAKQALATSSAVVLELAELQSDQQMGLAMLRNATLMVLPAGQSLWDLLPDADEAIVKNNPNIPPGKAGTLYGYQPWVVAAMLSIPLCETLRKTEGLKALDMMLAEDAARRGVPLLGLETVEEQLKTFASMPLDLQTRYLVSVAKLGATSGDYFETLISLYAKHQVTAYMPFAKRAQTLEAGDEKLLAFVEEDMVRQRNHRMADRARDILTRGNVFIAVGALHLPGKEGLVELLRQQGYKVTPIN